MKDKIVQQVVEKFEQRSEIGIKKYGTTLEKNDKDDFLIHLQEELMDATLYVEKLKSRSIFDKIREWAKEKGIYDKGTVESQYEKLIEEVEELRNSIVEKDREEFIDAIGDCVVVLTNLAQLQGISIEECIDSAYNVIRKRTGVMINGSFVKNG